jgi:hypothetical protein
MRFTVNDASQSAAGGVDTRSSHSIFDSVSQTLPLRMTELERKHLVETDRHIAECEAYIAKQRELSKGPIQQ